MLLKSRRKKQAASVSQVQVLSSSPLLLSILGHLDAASDLCAAGSVSRLWRATASSDVLWQKVFLAAETPQHQTLEQAAARSAVTSGFKVALQTEVAETKRIERRNATAQAMLGRPVGNGVAGSELAALLSRNMEEAERSRRGR